MLRGLGSTTASLLRSTLDGDNKLEWETIQTGIPCRLITLDAKEVELYAALGVHLSHQVAFHSGISILSDDKLLIGSRTMLIKAILPEDQFGGKYMVVNCLEVEGR